MSLSARATISDTRRFDDMDFLPDALIGIVSAVLIILFFEAVARRLDSTKRKR